MGNNFFKIQKNKPLCYYYFNLWRSKGTSGKIIKPALHIRCRYFMFPKLADDQFLFPVEGKVLFARVERHGQVTHAGSYLKFLPPFPTRDHQLGRPGQE